MKIGRQTKIGISLLTISVLLWQLGFFNRYNYLTAKVNIWNNTLSLVTIGIPLHHCGAPCAELKKKFGFYESNVGCVVTGPQLRGIDAYNNAIEKHLTQRNGKDWRKKYQMKLDSLIKDNIN